VNSLETIELLAILRPHREILDSALLIIAIFGNHTVQRCRCYVDRCERCGFFEQSDMMSTRVRKANSDQVAMPGQMVVIAGNVYAGDMRSDILIKLNDFVSALSVNVYVANAAWIEFRMREPWP
jgi:hypothetical protein